MTAEAWLILLHQLLFQGMFFTKNIILARKLGQPIRGFNREANLSIVFFIIFIGLAFYFALRADAPGTVSLLGPRTALIAGLLLMGANLLVGLASLKDLGESWRVGVIETQRTALIESGIYRYSRNPYFLSYLLMFAGYTVLLQNLVLLALSVPGFILVHVMILKEEQYLSRLHGQTYRDYSNRVARYLLI